MKNILKYINSLPLPFTMKHYEKFDDSVSKLKDGVLDSSESWDVLRKDHSLFSISENREEWLLASESTIKKDGQDGGLKQRANDISALIKENAIESVFSVGVGGAGLEYQIKKILPETKMVCSEYSQVNIDALKKVFLECDSIIFFDIKEKDWSKNIDKKNNQLFLLYRVDPHFTDKEWREIFENMYQSNIKNILFIPCSFLTAKSIFKRLSRRIYWMIEGTKNVFSGYLRTRNKFKTFWRGLYDSQEYDFGGIKGFLLRKI